MFGPPICLDAICLNTLLYVWIPPVHTQHIESMLCHTKWVSICPIHLDAPIGVDAPCMFGWSPVCLNVPICLEQPVCLHAPHVWTPPICLDAPICLDTTHIFGYSHMFGYPAVCLGCPHMCSTAGNTFQHAAMFGCPLYVLMPQYVWTPPICLDAPFMFGHLLYVWMPPYDWMHPLYVWMPTCLDGPLYV